MVEIRELSEYIGDSVTVQGWVEQTRTHGKVAFTVVRDGTGLLQGVLVRTQVDDATWSIHGSLTQETLVTLTGEVKEDARAPGGYELSITDLKLIAPAPDYPIQPLSLIHI